MFMVVYYIYHVFFTTAVNCHSKPQLDSIWFVKYPSILTF